MQPIMRLLTRLQGEGDGLILGALLRAGQGKLLPNSIYELQYCDVTGNILLQYKGRSGIASEGESCANAKLRVHWANDVGDILANAGKYAFLTEEEIDRVYEQQTGE